MFDYEGAKRAGYSDDEIQSYIAQKEQKERPWEEAGVSPLTYRAGMVQQKLGESKILPVAGQVAGGILGAPSHSRAGQAAGAGAGEYLRQILETSKGFTPETYVPTKQEVGQIGKTAATAAIVDWLFSKVGKAVGKVTKPVTEKVGDWLKGTGEATRRQISSQVLQPPAGTIRKDIGRRVAEPDMLGISETLQEVQKRGITGTAKEIFAQAVTTVDDLGKQIGSFLKTNKGQLPGLSKGSMEQIAGSLDDEITKQSGLGNGAAVKTLENLKGSVSKTKSFEGAYKLLKDLSSEIWRIYEKGAPTSEVGSIKARGYKLVADNLRITLKELAKSGGFPEWASLMNEYHFYSKLSKFAEYGDAAAQGKIHSVNQLLLSRMFPWGLSRAQQAVKAARPATKKVGGGIGIAAKGAGKLGEWLTKGALLPSYRERER